MNELRLLFGKSADGYSVRLIPSFGSASEPIPFEPFLDEEDFDDLRWYLEEFLDLPDYGSRVRAQRVEESLRSWGRRLFDALFNDGDQRELLRHMQQERAPRVLTVATSDPEILRLPWELMADVRGPLVQQDVAIRRQLERAQIPIGVATSIPLRILYVVSRPTDLGFIDPRLSSRSMLDALGPLGDDVRVDFCRPPTLPRLEEMLSQARRDQAPYHLVHFDGHGTFLPEIELGALCFEKPGGAAALCDGRTDYVPADRLGDLLARYQIPLVILEACRTGTIGRQALFRAVAPRLIEAGVGSVISMSHAVHVEAARILLERFYRELVAGGTIGEALGGGRAALVANPHRWIEYGPGGRTVELQDWYLPHLYQRAGDLQLVPQRRWAPGAATKREEARFDVFLSHQHADSVRVERIALELKNRYGLRVWLDKWETGPGPLHDQCVRGVEQSRYVLLVVSEAALRSSWVAAEQDWARVLDPQGRNIVPLLFDDVPLPPDLAALLWKDFRDSSKDSENIEVLAALLRRPREPPRGANVSRRREDIGAFPPPPNYGFQGRASELYELERQLRSHRAVLLHAMGGMGKTALATEAAHWWTRSGLFPDGACFLSFEQPLTAARIIQVLGTYLEGDGFNAHPYDEQRRRVRDLFRDRRVLMVWDNFESVLPAFQPALGASFYSEEERAAIFEVFRDWTQGEAGEGRLLITCRPEESGLAGARRYELEGLARSDSHWLLLRVLDTAGVDPSDPRFDRDTLNELLDLIADHPLSIELVAPQLRQIPPETVISDFGALLARFARGQGEERNESLLASLEFSKCHLSPAAQAALPWLGLFRGGVFEYVLLAVSELDVESWKAIREELAATALVVVEDDLSVNGLPFLRFHPTLAYAVSPPPSTPELRRLFGAAYLALMVAKDAVSGQEPAARSRMAMIACEEANVFNAMRWAVADEDYELAATLGGEFRLYLEISGRLRERDAWAEWLARAVRKGKLNRTSAMRELDEAWALLKRGQGNEAEQRVEGLIERLRPGGAELAPTMALAQSWLGRVVHGRGESLRAIPLLEDAAVKWEAIAARGTADDSSELAVTLGDLANARRGAGQFEEALVAAEQSFAIWKELADDRHIATSLTRTAQMLLNLGRYDEADARLRKAMEAAQTIGDKGLRAVIFQSQGFLAIERRQPERARYSLNRAMRLFQEMHDEGAVMRTCNGLGVVEHQEGRRAEARAWYERSLEIARALNDPKSLAAARQNIANLDAEEES
jgi:tetratricopeptide (TPR) repeat protein